METAATQSPSLGAVAPETVRAPSLASRLVALAPGVLAAGIVATLGLEHGGYFATAWGPTTIVTLIAAAAVLVLHRRPNLDGRALVVPGLLALLLAWTLASSTWGSPSEAVPEAQRTLLYVSAALALGLSSVAA